MSNGRDFTLFLTLRTVMAIISWSWHVPDETWQSVEISHKIVFGVGYETWEWKHAIRSFIHPLIFVPGMLLLRVTGTDQWSSDMVVLMPRLTQGAISAVGDVCILNFCRTHFGRKAKKWMYVIYAGNFFMNYCSSRTLVNTLEMALTNMALRYYPSSAQKTNSSWKYIVLIALSFTVRSTTAIFWLPLVLHHVFCLFQARQIHVLFTEMIPVALIMLTLETLVDSLCYGRMVIVHWNFFLTNILQNVSALYGEKPWHWYLTSALPVMMAILGLYPFMKSCFWYNLNSTKSGLFAKTLVWTLVIYSSIGHKEMRFLLPIIPLATCFAADFLTRRNESFNRFMGDRVKVIVFLALNIPTTLYLSMIHQSGTTAVMSYLSKEAQHWTMTDGIQSREMKVLFLMPCHSTPFYSHMHQNVSMQFLTCEPNLEDLTKNADEADEFFQNPPKWVAETFSGDKAKMLPTHIVMYDILVPLLHSFLEAKDFKVCADLFHTHFPDGRIGYRVKVFCN